MQDIEADVDEEVAAELEEEMMLEMEMEHWQVEAEIAMNTRQHGDVLLPYFGNEEEMFSDLPPEVWTTGSAAETVVCKVNDTQTECGVFPATLMAKTIWKVLGRSDEVSNSAVRPPLGEGHSLVAACAT